MNEQTSIFDVLYPKYKITKPIRLIELFAGYGSQALALKYLGLPFEHWKICEWATKSIQAYKDIHFTDDNNDYSDLIPKEDLIDILTELGISSNYNEPMTLEQIKRIPEEKLRTIYNNICATHNLVNIQQVKGSDLEISDTDKYDYIMTYSFPCQDLSLAGKGKGMSDTSTRSGMLWEVERILDECKELGNLPQILLMENVPMVHSIDNVKDFNKWQLKLEQLGYKNYFQDLIATDYGIPQTRNRCFMVSILGDHSYTFPKPIPLKLKLKDLLEDEVDEKYYLSDKMLDYCYGVNQKESKFPRGERFIQSIKQTNEKGIATTITTNAGNRPTDNFIYNKSLKETLEKNKINNTCYIDTYNKVVDEEKARTITTGVNYRNNTFLGIIKDTENYIEWKEKGKLDIDCRASKEDKVSTTICTTPKNKVLIKNATKKGYLEATDGDGIDISSRMEYHRGTVQKGKTQTLTTSCDVGVVVLGIYSPSNHEASRIIDSNYSAPTFKENHGTINATLTNDLRIRKLTPKECGRLMNVKDEDIDKLLSNQSNASAYHLFGDSICTNVLMAIFGELLYIDWRKCLWKVQQQKVKDTNIKQNKI